MHSGENKQSGDIVERNVCKVTPLPVEPDVWDRLSTEIRNTAQRLGRPTAECSVENHFLYTTVLRLRGIGEVDDTLLRGCRDVMHRNRVLARVEVERKTVVLRCYRTPRRHEGRSSAIALLLAVEIGTWILCVAILVDCAYRIPWETVSIMAESVL